MSTALFELAIDWDMDGSYGSRNDGLLLSSLMIERGRRYVLRADGTGFEEENTGQFSATLVDLERDYDPYHTASPLYPNVGPGRLFRMQARIGSAVYPLMAGTLSEPVIGLDPDLLTVALNGTDGWSYLRDQKNRISIAMQENICADAAIQLILDTINWPALWGSSLMSGVESYPYWWISGQSAASAIHDVAFSELGSVFIAGDGKVTFHSRHINDSALVTIRKENIMHGTLNILEPWEIIRNSVEVVATPRIEQTVGALWTLPQAIRLNANSSTEIFIDFKFNNELCPARNVIQPVAFTDFQADTNSDGSGSDLTSDWDIVADVFSTGAKLTISNNGTAIGWLWTASVRGNAIAAGNTIRYRVDDAVSQANLKAIRSFKLETDWMQNPNAARAAANYLGGLLPQPRKFLSFDLLPDPDLQFTLDLGMLINVYLPEDGINGVYRIYYLRHEFMDVAGITTRTSLMVEPYTAPSSDYWIVPKQIPMKVAY